MSTFRLILFFISVVGFLTAGAIHGMRVAGREVDFLPFEPMLLHFLVLLIFIPTIIVYRFAGDRTPQERAAPMKALWNSRPKWMFALAVLLFIYAVANFIFLAGEDTLRRFSGHWLVFFWAAVLLNYPWSSPPEEMPAAPPSSDDFHAEHVSTFRRVMDGAYAFAVGWTAVLSVGALGVAAYTGELFYLVAAGMFLVVTIANFFYRRSYMRYHIRRAGIAGDSLRLEYLDYDVMRRLEVPLSELRTEIDEKRMRGGSLFRLRFLRGQEELLNQANTRWWKYDRLEALQKRIEGAKAASRDF